MVLSSETILVADFVDGTLCQTLNQMSLGLQLSEPPAKSRITVAVDRLRPICCVWHVPGYSLSLEVGLHQVQIAFPRLPHIFITVRPWTDTSGQVWGLFWPAARFVLSKKSLSGLSFIDTLYDAVTFHH
jgi:hypothetical protein